MVIVNRQFVDRSHLLAVVIRPLSAIHIERDGVDEYIEGWSKRVEYDNKSDKIELFRQARLKRGEDEVKGDYISYNMNSEFFQVIGSNERGVETGADNRVRIIFQPKNKSNSAVSDTSDAE